MRSITRHGGLAAAFTVGSFLVLVAGAQAVHWPYFGGENGRSGYQPVGEGFPPLTFRYSKTDASDQNIVTSPLTSTGPQVIVYATANGNVHVQALLSGAPVGPESGVDVDDGAPDADAFTGNGGSVTPVETSPAGALGQVFAVHNDDNQGGDDDIAIAQVNEATGAVVQDVPVAGTDGYTISSSVVATGPDVDNPATPGNETGNRRLFFVASNGTTERLFRVPITGNAATTGATIGLATSTADINATPLASPTIAFLQSPGGTATAYVAVGTATSVETFAAADLSDGPESGQLAGPAQTPTVPVTPFGFTPGAPSSGAIKAPFIYVASAAGDSATVYKLQQPGASDTLTNAVPPQTHGGTPAPALATDQEVEGATVEEGKVILTTSINLYLLGTDDLTADARLSTAALNPGQTGFSRTTAAASGGFAYVTRDSGEQLVISLRNARPVAPGSFTPNLGAAGSTRAFGQPSISRGFIQFASDKGLFVYSNACGNNLSSTAGNDTIFGTPFGDNVGAGAGDDTASGAEADDCLGGGDGNDALGGDAGRDLVVGDAGADRLFGGDGDDRMGGGTGTDLVLGQDGNDRIGGSDDYDRMSGGAGEDLVQGEAGNDRMGGADGNDRMAGGLGEDDLKGEAGNDRMGGSAGNDRMNGGPDLDLVQGEDGNDRMGGGTGADTVVGAAGDDLLVGEAGDDQLVAGAGANRLYGGEGDDVLRARNGTRDTVDCGEGSDRAEVDAADRVVGCETVTGPAPPIVCKAGAGPGPVGCPNPFPSARAARIGAR